MFRSFRLRGVLFFIGTSIALLAMLVGIIAFKVPFNAHAHATTNTLYVSHNPIGSNTSCADPGYNSVQAAVDAANKGDTVYLCTTVPYAEQVIITKAITLTGDPGATIQPPLAFPATAAGLPPQFTTDNLFLPQAIVIVWGAGSNANIVNLHIEGPLTSTGGCAAEEYGVLVIAGGTATLNGDHVTDIRDSDPALYGCQFGVAIQVGREYWPNTSGIFLVENFVGHATITKTTVTGYQKNGITVDGPGSKSTITKSTVQGAGRYNALGNIIAQNGIQISRGAVAKVESNFVADNAYTGPAPASSAGILVFGGCGDPLSIGVVVEGNVLSNNDVGIYLNNYSASTACNAPATQKTYDKALNNTISNNAVTNVGPYTDANNNTYTGYQAGIDDIGNNDVINHNTITGIGYTPARTTPGGPFVIPIDTISYPTTHPRIRSNRII